MVSEEQFRSALSRFASGITVITTVDGSGAPVGLTATAFSSVSLRPPLVLVCVDKSANSHPAFALKSHFVVNMLAEEQTQLSSLFASSSAQNRFANVAYKLNSNKIPVLDGCIASLECQVENIYEGGDHTIFVASVLDVSTGKGNPLLYYSGRYGRFEKQNE